MDIVTLAIALQAKKIAQAVGYGPAGTYATLVALQTANPNHAYIYVVTADGNWYYYNDETLAWTVGGLFIDSSGYNALDTRLTTAEGNITTLNANDTTVGSVAKSIKDAVDLVSTELSTVKVKTVENDLAIADIRRDQTLANQSEAKISVSDYGILALPKNATGNLKMKREGLTARNIVNGASIAIGGTVTFASVLSNIYYDVLNKVQITGTGSNITATNNSGAIANMAIINLTQTFSSIPDLATSKNIFPTYFADTKNVPMTGRYRGSNADETEFHDLYFTAPEGRSVPSTKDSVEVQDGRLVHVQNVQRYVLQASDLEAILTSGTNRDDVFAVKSTTFPLASTWATGVEGKLTVYFGGNQLTEVSLADWDVANTNHTFGTSSDTFYIFFPKGTYASIAEARTALAGTVIYYQLATPITTPIDSDGAIPAGASVYWEPAIPDVGIYTTKFDIFDTDHPISSIDKLYKVDFATGVQTLLTDAVIAGDGLSFTSASLTSGDLVNVIYFYSVANPEGLTTAEYLNSNVVVADSANGKYYKYKPVVTNGAIASWTVTEVV